jgi:hypothetical protein
MVDLVDYINATAACSNYQGIPIADGYRYLVKFFNCALLDRSQTLQPGFPYRILDTIPTLDRPVADLNTLCGRRVRELLAHAQQHDQLIHVLWSGGIDSTVTLTALLKAASEANDTNRLNVFLSRYSIKEYPRFFAEVIKPSLRYQKISRIDKALDTQASIVAGELGDQIFGSVLAANYLRPAGLLRRKDERLPAPWGEVLRPAMRQRLKSSQHTDAAYQFLQPQLQQSPIPLVTLFDVLWCN